MKVTGVNQLIKTATSLKQKKARDSSGLFIIEGERFIDEIPPDFDRVAYISSESYAKNNPESRYPWDSKGYIIPDDKFKKITDTVTPSGLLAICGQKTYTLESVLTSENTFILICECLQDPGNLGTLIRTAHACGCHGVILSQGCVDLYNPKVLRASAGSAFRIPVVENVDLLQFIPQLKSKNINVVATHLNTDNLPYEINLTESTALIVGNEGNGISEEIAQAADILIKIPMPGKAESLNASVATGVLLYEVVRQRYYNVSNM